MQTLPLPGGTDIRYYTDLDELPVLRHAAFSRYQIEASALDLDVDAIKNRLLDLRSRLAEGRTEDVDTGLTNLYISLNVSETPYRPLALSFACLVAEVAGVGQSDLSDNALGKLVETISSLGMTKAMIDEAVADVKKNSLKTETATFLTGTPDMDSYWLI